MKNAFRKNIFREIKGSLGRYFAIMAITALGVGFFSGLQITQEAMLRTGDDYVNACSMYDFKLQSTLGLTDDDVAALLELDGINAAEGSYSDDAYCTDDTGTSYVLKLHSITDEINTLDLVSGRLPESDNECVVDSQLYSDDPIGMTFTIDTDDDSSLSREEYTIVGTVRSVNYMNLERGTTTLGSGSVSGFVYLPEEAFSLDYYTEVYLDADTEGQIYSDGYQETIDSLTGNVEDKLSKLALARYDELSEAVPEAMREAAGISEPQVYVFTRADNIGYSCLESDSQVVKGIARVFPIFFFLVAALVCMTTMTRMIGEQRTQIGTLKALGYLGGAILWKYVFYSGSAAFLGAVAGYFLGTWLFPAAIWAAYSILYGFSDIVFVFDAGLAAISAAVALLCSAGVTYIVCKRELHSMPAQLMRPKAPKAGKRIFLERLHFFWRHLSFLRKVSLRNVFRDKKRLFMMLLGVGGCTALLLTGFGIHDSIGNLVEYQFDEISMYDYTVYFDSPQTEETMDAFTEEFSDEIDCAVFVSQHTTEADTSFGLKTVYLIASDDENITELFDLHGDDGETVGFPGEGEIVLTEKIASQLGVSVGDEVTLWLDDTGTETLTATLSGICKSYVYNYAYMTASAYEAATGKTAEYCYAYCSAPEGADTHSDGSRILAADGVSNVVVAKDTRERIAGMMDSLNLVVWLVTGSAAALAIIVLINLSNINITERQREIATIKVLGFSTRETSSYVFRENIILSLMGTVIGLPLGIALHRFVMSQITVDIITLDSLILPQSYVYSFAFIILFALIVDLLMRGKLSSISMTESLKSVE